MQFSQIIAALFAGVAVTMAAPSNVAQRNEAAPLCPSGLYNNPECCATDILGIADLDCAAPTPGVKSYDDFTKACASTGARARCCSLPLAGQGVLCTTPLP